MRDILLSWSDTNGAIRNIVLQTAIPEIRQDPRDLNNSPAADSGSVLTL
jgi:hypothetical protein